MMQTAAKEHLAAVHKHLSDIGAPDDCPTLLLHMLNEA